MTVDLIRTADGAVIKSGLTLGMYDTLPAGHQWVDHVPALAEAAAVKLLEIQAWRDASCSANVTVPVSNVPYSWQADKRSQDLLSNSVSMVSGGVIPCPTVWRSADNINVLVGIQDLKNICAAIALQTSTAYAKSWALKAQVAACTSVSQITAISVGGA
jgi:hypothetical protein